MVSFIGSKRWRVITAMVLVLSLMLVLPVSQVSAADMTHEVTNVGDKSFTVTWVTDAAETGYVNYGTSADSLNNTDYDDRGEATEDDTHHVTITGLTAGTPYYYQIVSGGVTYDNGGVPYEITTGPGLAFAMPEMISGTVYKADGVTAAEGTIIYASIGTSQVLSALSGSSGTWGLNIAPIRTADYQGYYTHSGSDNISIEAQGAADGTDSQTVTIATAKAGAPDMTLAVGPAEVSLKLSMTLQGRPSPPDDQWVISVDVWLHTPDAAWTEVEGHGSLYHFETQTSNEGVIELIVVPGTYDIRLKGLTTLKNLASGVEVSSPGPVVVDIGELIESDVNGDNKVTALDYSAVIMCFGYAVDDPAAPEATPNCDFNNDGYITGLDYSTVVANFGLGGADIE